MKKRWFAVFTAMLLVLSALTGCSASKDAAAPAAGEWYVEDGSMQYGGFDNKNTASAPEAPMEMAEDHDVAEAESAAEYTPGNMVNDLTYGENVKLIFRAWLHLQTLDFAQAEKDLNQLVEKYGGYFESVYTDNGSYYSNYSYLSGSYTVRVPAENYDRFLSAVGNTCHVVNLNKTTEDVGLQYSDTQMRLQTEPLRQSDRLLHRSDRTGTGGKTGQRHYGRGDLLAAPGQQLQGRIGRLRVRCAGSGHVGSLPYRRDHHLYPDRHSAVQTVEEIRIRQSTSAEAEEEQ